MSSLAGQLSRVMFFLNAGPLPKGPTIDSLEVLAAKSSNASLTCWTENCPSLFICSGEWYLNDNLVPLEKGEKYDISEKKTRTKCQTEFSLFIYNVTENDEGIYSCHWLCESQNTTKAAIDLKVFDDLPTGKSVKRSHEKKYMYLSLEWILEASRAYHMAVSDQRRSRRNIVTFTCF